MTDMKALLRFPGDRKVALVDCPIPALSPHAVMVRTTATVVSPGTEFSQARQTKASLLHKAWQRPDLVALTFSSLKTNGIGPTFERVRNRLGRPLPLGYSGSGIITALGDNVTGLSVGDRVAIGGMGHANHAEYNLVPRNLISPVPDGIDDRHAAFTTLYALALHALRQGRVVIGHRIAIVGAGLIGQLVAQAARTAGAFVDIIEPNAIRRDRAKQSGAHATHASIDTVKSDDFDAVFLCLAATAPHRQIDEAARLCRDRGTIVCVGDIAPSGRRDTLYRKEIDIRQVRSYGPGRYDPDYEGGGMDYPVGHVRWTVNRYMQAALALMADHRLDPTPLITRNIAFADSAALFAEAPDPNGLATVIDYRDTRPSPASSRAFPPSSLSPSLSPYLLADDTPPNRNAAPGLPTAAIRLGIIGAGNFAGGILLPTLANKADATVCMIASSGGLSAMTAARKLPGARAVSDPQEVLDDDTLNGIVIATRHDSHAELATRAIAAGKHVWLEKPLAIAMPELAPLRDAAKRQTGIFMLGHNRRYAPMSQMLKTCLPAGPKQFDYRIRIQPLPREHWLNHPQQGGRTIGEISHFIDLTSHLADSPLVALRCRWLNQTRGDSIWQMEFADGSTGTVSYMQGHKTATKEVLDVSAPDFDACLHDWRKLIVNGQTVRRHWRGPDKGHAVALTQFVAAIKTGKPAPLTPSLRDEIDLMEQILTAAG